MSVSEHTLSLREPLTAKQILAFSCPTCGAAPGEKCKLSTGLLRFEPHQARRLDAVDRRKGTQMNSIALLSGHPPFPNPREFRRAKTYGFWCEICAAAYTLFVPEGFSFEQAEACQKIGRGA